MNLTEFLFLFKTDGAQKTQSETSKVSKSTNDLAKQVAALAATYVGFKKVLGEVFNYAKGGEQLGLMAEQAGLGAEKLEAYGNALQNYGGDLSSATATLTNLNQQMQDLKFGKGGAVAEAAMRYGVSLEGQDGLATGEELLLNIAKRMETLSSSEQIDLAKKMGLDQATTGLVRQGVQGLTEELQNAKKFSLYSAEDLEQSRKFQISLREVRASIEKIWAVVGRALMPIIQSVFDIGTKLFLFLSEHKGFILGLLSSISAILLTIAIYTGAISLPLIGAVAALVAVGAAIGLIVDDIVTFFEGGDSITGDFIEGIKALGQLIADIAGIIYNNFVQAWVDAAAFIEDLINTLGEWIKGFFSSIWGSITTGIITAINFVISAYNKVAKFVPGLKEMELLNTGRSALANTDTPLNTMTTNTTTIANGGNNSVKIDQVNVNTQATDAAGISAGIGGALETQFNDVLFENAGGQLA